MLESHADLFPSHISLPNHPHRSGHLRRFCWILLSHCLSQGEDEKRPTATSLHSFSNFNCGHSLFSYVSFLCSRAALDRILTSVLSLAQYVKLQHPGPLMLTGLVGMIVIHPARGCRGETCTRVPPRPPLALDGTSSS